MVGLMNTPSSTSGFSFGQATPTSSTSSFSLGQSLGSSQPATGFSFGSSGQTGTTATVNPLTSSSFSFGPSNAAPQANSSGGFSLGQVNPTSSGGFSLGQVNPTSSGGFSLGQVNPTSSGGFSLGQVNPTSSGGFSLGQVNPTPSGGFSFGQTNPSTLSGGFSFGQGNPTSSSSGGFNFGQTNSSLSSTGFNIGQTNPTSSGGFSLTQANPANPTPSTTGFSFSQPSTSAPTGGFTLGQVISSTSLSGNTLGLNTPSSGLFGQPSVTGFGFGQTTRSTTGTSSSGLFSQAQATNPSALPAGTGLFGQTQTSNAATSSTGLFGQSTPGSTSGIFSQSTSSQPTLSSPGPNFGLSTNPSSSGGLFSQTSNAPTSSGLNFGISAGSSTGFGFTPSSTSSSVAPSSIFPSISTPSMTNLGLGGNLQSTTGRLEGSQSTSIDSGIGSAISKDGKSFKEITLPQDTIAMFEAYKDTEKKCSEDNVRQTATPFHKLVEDTKKLRQHIVQLSNQHNQLHSSARKLKSAVIQEAENVEMARRTQDTPMNLQGDNKAPEQFFLRLVRSFEERMTFCRNRIEEVEKCARSNGGATEITSEDMKEVLKKEHEMVKMLAAKIYTLHNQLINYANQSSNPDLAQPEALFRRGIPEEQPLGISHKNSSILRPALGEDGSGLLNFQNGQQRAKALSLGAAPPTMPLNQTSIPNLLGSSNQSNLFTGTSNPMFGPSFLNFNTSTNPSFGFSNKAGFGTSSTNTSSLFGNQSVNQIQTGGLFGPSSNSTSLSVGAKSLKKSQENEETHRKRRM